MRVTPISTLPAKPRVRRTRRRGSASSSPPAPLVLVSAAYDAGNDPPILTLTFSRAVDVAGLDGSAIVVDDDAFTGLRYVATGGASQPDETSVALLLTSLGFPTGPGTTMTAGAGNGIVAVDDGEAWAGVADLALPFP